LPALKSQICTEKFLIDVRYGRVFCPKYNEITLLPCLNPPSLDILRGKVIDGCEAMMRQADVDHDEQAFNKWKALREYLINHAADRNWLTIMLSSFNHKDEIFDPAYVPPRKALKVLAIEKVDNFDGLYDTLKTLPAKQLKKRGRRLHDDHAANEKKEPDANESVQMAGDPSFATNNQMPESPQNSHSPYKETQVQMQLRLAQLGLDQYSK